ncbi:MAG: hypothetical protein ACKOXP_04905 [Flavobacteriales bacterium]
MDKKEEKINKIKELHPLDFRGLAQIYQFRKIHKNKSFIFSIGVALICFQIIHCSGIDSIKLRGVLNNLIQIGLTLNAGLIGLSLTGLTLIVTFGSEKLLMKGIELNYDKNFQNEKVNEELEYSMYQKSVAKFTFSILVQIIALFLFISYSINGSFGWNIQNHPVFFNNFFIFVGLFFIAYPLALVLQMTLNIFSLSQINHIVYFYDEYKKKNLNNN